MTDTIKEKRRFIRVAKKVKEDIGVSYKKLFDLKIEMDSSHLTTGKAMDQIRESINGLSKVEHSLSEGIRHEEQRLESESDQNIF